MTDSGAGPRPALLLIDLENMIGAYARPPRLARRLDTLTAAAGPVHAIVTATTTARLRPGAGHELQRRGIELITVRPGADAADRALLTVARGAAAAGCRRYVIASNDRGFAQLAALGDLEVITWTHQTPAASLIARAAQVHRLPCPGTLAPARPAPAPPPAELATAPDPPPRKAAAGTAASPDQTAAPLTIPARNAVTAGLLFGAAAAASSAAVRRLLRRAP